VQAEDDVVAGTGFGEVELEPAGADPAVDDSLDGGRFGHDAEARRRARF
jgi:hypothetical protein